jgi:hypothetical protein
MLRRARPPAGPPTVSRKELGENMTPEEIALEFAEIFDDLPPEQINEMLAKNIPFETIEFFSPSRTGRASRATPAVACPTCCSSAT